MMNSPIRAITTLMPATITECPAVVIATTFASRRVRPSWTAVRYRVRISSA